MNLLLDTHALLWALSGPEKLSKGARDAIRSGGNVIFVSAATAWEIAIKRSLGKLKAPSGYLQALEYSRFLPLDITSEHALGVEDLPRHHTDPFDRLLISQARIEGLTLVSRDMNIAKYDVRLIEA